MGAGKSPLRPVFVEPTAMKAIGTLTMGVLGAMVAFVAAGESARGDPWTLPQPRALAEHDISVGGWLSGGVYGNQYGAPDN